MRCPECRKPTNVERIDRTNYRIECSSAACYYSEEFEYVPPVERSTPVRRGTPVRPINRGTSRNRLTYA